MKIGHKENVSSQCFTLIINLIKLSYFCFTRITFPYDCMYYCILMYDNLPPEHCNDEGHLVQHLVLLCSKLSQFLPNLKTRILAHLDYTIFPICGENSIQPSYFHSSSSFLVMDPFQGGGGGQIEVTFMCQRV